MNNLDNKYFSLLHDILDNGSYKETRSGEVISVFDRNLSFSMKEGFPLLTTKKMYTRGVIHELLWFLKGETNIKYLVENNVHIWDDDAYRYYKELFNKSEECEPNKNKLCDKEEFLKNVVDEKIIFFSKIKKIGDNNILTLYNYKFGELGDIYGKQWRCYGESKKDQIKEIIDTLKTNPNDRRLLCLAYNPDVIGKVALPPCHILFQFYARPLNKWERLNWLQEHNGNKYDEYKTIKDEELNEYNVPQYELNLKWIQRSVDSFLGLPFNITSYALLLSMIAQCVNMTVGNLSCSLGDCHIYKQHLNAVNELLERSPMKYSLPKLKLNPHIKDIDSFKIEDIEIQNYESYPSIKAPLCVG